MNKEQILEITKNLISSMQIKTNINMDVKKYEMVYLMGYNDGVLDFCDELVSLLEKVGEQGE